MLISNRVNRYNASSCISSLTTESPAVRGFSQIVHSAYRVARSTVFRGNIKYRVNRYNASSCISPLSTESPAVRGLSQIVCSLCLSPGT